MAWTDERVARLSKLWADGLSASQIAADLGGVTRNAVIGKVHRLGLSGRVKPAAKTGAASASSTARKARPASGGGGARVRTSVQATATQTVGATALKVEVLEEEVVETVVDPRPTEDVVVPISRKLTLMDLTESTCKWPTGDPTLPGFSFCGHKTQEEKPYCEFHSKIAFQPPSERRRRR